jgi:hypothetical protein
MTFAHCLDCDRPKAATKYPRCRTCSARHKFGADCFKVWRLKRGPTMREKIEARMARRWQELFPGVPWLAARRIYAQGYKAGLKSRLRAKEREAA